MQSDLITLARIARAKIEWLAKAEQKEIGEPNWRDATVRGYCGIAAAYLERLANLGGLHPVYVVGEFRTSCGDEDDWSKGPDGYETVSGHAWLKFNGSVIDITASQFASIHNRFDRRVFVCKTTDPHFREFAIGPAAKEIVSTWYDETLDELIEKTDAVWRDDVRRRL